MGGRGRWVVKEAIKPKPTQAKAHEKAPANHPGVFPNISGKTAALAWFA